MDEIGDIVQIIDENHHWFPAFVVVTEPKPWGCQGYMIMVTSNDPATPNNPAFIRLDKSIYENVGKARIVLSG